MRWFSSTWDRWINDSSTTMTMQFFKRSTFNTIRTRTGMAEQWTWMSKNGKKIMREE